MRRSTKILAASAVALSISGLGATGAFALDEETACSDVSNVTVCVLAENDDDTASTIVSATDDESILALLGQVRDEDGHSTVLLAATDSAIGYVAQHDDEGQTITGAGVSVADEDGNQTYVVALNADDTDGSDGDDSRLAVLVGQEDGGGNRATGVESTTEDCVIVFGSVELTDCPVEPGVLSVPAVPYVNLP